LLCCIPKNRPVAVITKDGSPRAAKHFWVWNPPLLDTNGKSLAIVELPKSRKIPKSRKKAQQQKQVKPKLEGSLDLSLSENKPNAMTRKNIFRRRHSADETALLLALAVTKGIRCIAFCKTRGLVEWVYERTLATLKQSQDTVKYISKVESYRGGYTKMERRQIEEKLFQNELLGVVGTSALELGVDIGGVDLTLHCGFPSSHASLLQQAGRVRSFVV
jgi:DEAD/DEAH box helicase domain-containing protein